MSQEARVALLATLEENRSLAERSPSPFYTTLVARMIDDVEAGDSPTWRLLEPYANEPATEYFPFRALAGVHHEVLAGERPDLAKHYPSAGGDGDAETAWPVVREAFAGLDPDVLADLAHPLQTNETSRCGALIGGFCEVARVTGLPLRVRELGASAGLNLHFDRYRYEANGVALGPADGAVRFVDYWNGGAPALDAPLQVTDRRGCDLAPIDPADEHGRLALQSCIWPDQLERLEMLRGALDVAREYPVTLTKASADEWAARELAQDPVEGEATVVFHSIFWIYPPEEVRAGISKAIAAAAAAATPEAPFAWVRYEEGDDPLVVELRVTVWPGGEERLLGTGSHHWQRVRWLA